MTKLEELRAEREELGQYDDMNPKVLAKIDAQIAELEASEAPKSGAKSAKAEKPEKQPKPPKAKKEKGEEEEAEDDNTAPPPPTGKWKADNSKDEKELDCEKHIKAARKKRAENNQDGIIKIIQQQRKAKSQKPLSDEEVDALKKNKTVSELRVDAGLSMPRKERLVDDAKRAVNAYAKKPLVSYIKRAETPELKQKIAEEAEKLKEKYAQKITEKVQELTKELEDELEKLLK